MKFNELQIGDVARLKNQGGWNSIEFLVVEKFPKAEPVAYVVRWTVDEQNRLGVAGMLELKEFGDLDVIKTGTGKVVECLRKS
jgi:hypothetical protein